MISRRRFLKISTMAAAGAGLSAAPAGRLLAAPQRDLRWVFLVDTIRCVGCGFCVKACKLENEIPYEAGVTRTWVERYVVLKRGAPVKESTLGRVNFLADSPMGGRDGYTKNDPQGAEVPAEYISKAFFVPKLCNQCDKPPCVQVCPVGATYQTADGVVLVDRSWCIGCGYCIMACPYGVRFFHPRYRVAEKCNWCYHRITRGMKPACVDACPFGARLIGNFMDFEDPVTKFVKTQRVNVLKADYGTVPMAYYVGLDEFVR